MSEENAVVRSVVEVHFPSRNMTLSYLNTDYDLDVGDVVFVDGKLEGERGQVVRIGQNFKVKPSDYKHIIAKVDTGVHGELYMAGLHFITFDREVIPYEKVLAWFKLPGGEDDDYIVGTDDTSFSLEDFSGLKMGENVFDRGHDYYMRNKVRYICMDGSHGRAVVEGSKSYEIEFEYRDGNVSKLICDCYCTGVCKHEIAAMLQLKETLNHIDEHYVEQYARTGYFAAVDMATLFLLAIDGKKNGRIYLN